ncbi:MAG: 2-5 ligase [Actinoallomurus sp.]|nr:2-5 ligase [Actinoallomurus sp.]
MRLFVALLPPETAFDEVEAAFGPRRDDWPALRWTPREFWHVTLAFYGEVDDRVAARLLPRLQRAAARHPRRELSFAGAGTFPRPAAARTLWTGIHADLQRLSDSCLAAGHHEGVGTGKHQRFHPHLTVARARSPVDLRPLVGELETYEGTPWVAGEIHLVQSHLGAKMRYETLHSWPLSPTGQN